MAKKGMNKSVLNEFRHYTGFITESDDYLLVQNMIPGLQNALEFCQEAASELEDVISRLEKLEKALQSDNNSLHLPAESQYLQSRLRNAMHKVLSSEPVVRKALGSLDSLT